MRTTIFENKTVKVDSNSTFILVSQKRSKLKIILSASLLAFGIGASFFIHNLNVENSYLIIAAQMFGICVAILTLHFQLSFSLDLEKRLLIFQRSVFFFVLKRTSIEFSEITEVAIEETLSGGEGPNYFGLVVIDRSKNRNLVFRDINIEAIKFAKLQIQSSAMQTARL